jgi:hypothetical protein
MSVSVRLESRHSQRMGKHFHSCSPHERSDMRERRLRRAAAPDIAPLIQASFTVIPREGGESSTPRPLGSNCRLWNTGSSGQAGRRRQEMGHPSCPSFGIAAGRKIRLEQARNAHPGNEPSMVLAEDLPSKGSGNADSQQDVRSSGWSGQGCPRDFGCFRAHPPSWRAASYRPLRAVWAVCAWALRGFERDHQTLQRLEIGATTQKELRK